MPYGRIQKLLCDEYSQFDDTVLIESPFAETTRDGKGLEQVHLGITPTKLIIASDYFDSLCYDSVMWYGQDPEVETLELMSLYPVEYVSLSIFRTSRRKSLKATFSNNVTRYFELGGFEKRRMFWNLWCERVLHLNPAELDETASDGSAEVCNETSWEDYCYNHISRDIFDWNGGSECLVSSMKCSPVHRLRGKWTDKHLYLGSLRCKEDFNRPVPVPGLGATPELKLHYVKPDWPSEDSDTAGNKCLRVKEDVIDYEVYTYTGEPTSNVTYTSMSKWRP